MIVLIRATEGSDLEKKREVSADRKMGGEKSKGHKNRRKIPPNRADRTKMEEKKEKSKRSKNFQRFPKMEDKNGKNRKIQEILHTKQYKTVQNPHKTPKWPKMPKSHFGGILGQIEKKSEENEQ